MASSNGKESSKITASIDSLKLSSKPASRNSSKHASSESVLSKKEKECLQMQECKKKLLEPQVIIRDDNVVLKSPPQKKIVMPPTINPEELAAATPTQRNWRGILIALLVIAAVLGLIVFSIVLLTPVGDGGRVKGRRPTLQTLSQLKYKPNNATWISDEELVFRDRWGGLTLYNVRNLSSRLFMTNMTFRELNAVDFKISADLKYVLLISDVRPGWKHARLARYHVYDLLNRNKIPISPIEDDRSAPLLQYAEWAPTGSGLVFVHDNDIYYKPKVLKNLVCRITSTGVPGVIFNGVPDFLYETEILRLDRALWFSSDGQTLLYLTFNDSLVHEQQYLWYGLDQDEPPAYPAVRSIRVPKMGTTNPVVTVYVVSLKTPKFLFPHAIQFTSQVDRGWYVRWTTWMTEKQIAVLLLNRPQNVSIVSYCSTVSYNCTDIYRDESDGSGWSGLGAEPAPDCGWCGGAPLLAGRRAVFTSAPAHEQSGTWKHAVRLTGAGRTTLTNGNFEITQLLGWDEPRHLLYVLGTAPDAAGVRHLYRVRVADPEWPGHTVCLTCPDADFFDTEWENSTYSEWPVVPTPETEDNTTEEIEPCLYNRITFSKNLSYYIQECLGPGPPVYSVWWSGAAAGAGGVGGAGGAARRLLLWDGAPLRQTLAALAAPQVKVFRVQLHSDREASVRLLLPPGFKETDDLPLPLILHMADSAGAPLTDSRWRADAGWYLSARGVLLAEVDARGTPGRGERARTALYRNLFEVDVEDQISVLTYLRDNLRMVDGRRIGVWARGYGAGAAVALAQRDTDNLTACYALLAPLVDLRQCSSYWSERLGAGSMSWSSWRGGAARLASRRVLLAHGSADRAAPPLHALRLARALHDAGAIYTHQIYPDEGHDFERSELHVYKTLERFFDECFGPVEVADWDAGGVGELFPFRD